MALLDIFGTTPSYYGGLLGEDELNRVRQQAQNQALQNTALALLQAGAPSRTPGNEALAIAQGLAGGQQAYRQTMQEGLKDKLQEMQIQDFMLKQREALAQRTRQEQMRQMFPQIFTQTVTPEQQTMYGEAARVVRDDEGNLMPGAQITPAQRQINVDVDKLKALSMLSNDPLSTFFNIAEKVPALRKAGFIGGMQQENPFTVFAKDETIPAPLRAVAAQYEKSYATGQIDQDTADKRLAELGTRVQSAQDRAQSQAGIESQREVVNKLQERMADLKEQGQKDTQMYRDMMANLAGQQFQLQKLLAEPKLAAAQEKVEQKAEAKTQLTDIVSDLATKYKKLRDLGAIVSSTDEGLGLENARARLSSSGFGQAFGSAFGTKAQTERESIEQTRPLLLNLIKNATGMSAQQMNSNAEMQLYLNAATNPKLSYEANMDALRQLDKLFGIGTVAKQIEEEKKNPKKPSGATRSGW
jgi:hypothetical protein